MSVTRTPGQSGTAHRAPRTAHHAPHTAHRAMCSAGVDRGRAWTHSLRPISRTWKPPCRHAVRATAARGTAQVAGVKGGGRSRGTTPLATPSASRPAPPALCQGAAAGQAAGPDLLPGDEEMGPGCVCEAPKPAPQPARPGLPGRQQALLRCCEQGGWLGLRLPGRSSWALAALLPRILRAPKISRRSK
jgi:hypothetical protein